MLYIRVIGTDVVGDGCHLSAPASREAASAEDICGEYPAAEKGSKGENGASHMETSYN